MTNGLVGLCQSLKNSMPPHRPCVRRSAHLQTSLPRFPMAAASSHSSRNQASAQPSASTQPAPRPPGKTARGRARARVPELPGTLSTTSSRSVAPRPPNIVWDQDCVQELVSWIVTHPADRNILYHDRNQSGSAPLPSPSEQPSGRQKKDIHTVIAKHIFEGKVSDYIYK